MNTLKLKYLTYFVFTLIVFQSCNQDDTIIETEVAVDFTVSDARTQVIVDWNKLYLDLDRYATGMRPNATARALAYIHLATYETVVEDMEGYTSNMTRLSGLNINTDERADNIDVALALNSCYARVLDHFMYGTPSENKQQITLLKSEKEIELSDELSNQIIQDSNDWGTYVAESIIAYSQTDTGAEQQILEPQPLSYEPPVGEGYWTYSADPERALFPYWESVRTFVISSQETSSVAPPMDYSEDVNSSFYAEMIEVYNMNNTAKEEDNEDLWVAEFWSDDVEGLMMTPPGRQISIASQLIENYDLDYDIAISLLVKLGFSLNDAAVSTWADKYEYMVMRPSVYIQEHMDPDFETNLYRFIFWPNPSFPGYPSGHSCFSSAAAGIFISHFGDAVGFTDRSHEGRTEFRGTPRGFDSFSQMAEENAYSRVPLGVHVRMDCTEGLRLGYEISDAVNNLDLTVN